MYCLCMVYCGFHFPLLVHKNLVIRFLNEAVSQAVCYTQICVCVENTEKGVIFDV